MTISADDRRVLQDASGFTEIRTAAILPPAVVALCADGTGKLADPGEKWNDSCLIYPNRASHRLIWAATNGEYCGVHYEQGGFVMSSHVLVATFKGDSANAKVAWRGFGSWLKNYEDFLDAV